MGSLYVRDGGIQKLIGPSKLLRKVGGVWQILGSSLKVKVAGAQVSTWTANSPPPAPTGLGAVPVNGGKINTSWAYPTNLENDYASVEVEQISSIGRAVTAHPTTTQQRTGYAHGVSIPLQARSVDTSGLMSAWVALPVVTTINALSGGATGVYPSWNGTSFTVAWTNPGNPYSDITAVEVYKSSGGAYTLAHTEAYVGGLRTASIASSASDTLHSFKVRVVNSAGFVETAPISLWSPPAPGTVKNILADAADTWAFTLGAWRNDGSVRSGQFDNYPMGMNVGLFFYGTKLWEACHGYTPIKGEIFMQRNGSQGFSGNLNFHGHGYMVKPAGQPGRGAVDWTSTSEFLGSGVSSWEIMPQSARESIAWPTLRGFGIHTDLTYQSEYRHFWGPANVGAAGQVRLTF